ncbi:MAG: murein biosynthesis integral membrane protein MurJ [bacterium]|nr:murein biosynthesis integral membrane protein MurJ [bacterium]
MRDIFKNGTSLLFRKQTGILSAAFVIMATYSLSYIVGLFKSRLLISHFFGTAAAQLDVYYAALVIPDTIFQLLVIGSLSAAFIPAFTRYLKENEPTAWKMAAATMNLVLVVFMVICSVVFLLATPLARLIAPGFSPVQIVMMSNLLRIMLGAQLFFSVSGFLTGVIQSHQRFLIPAMAPVAYNLGIIGGILFLSPMWGIYGPAAGMVIGAILHMAVQLPLAYKLGFRFMPIFNLKLPGVKEVAKLMPPRALALGIDQIEQFVAVTLASMLSAGSLSLLNVARLVYTIPTLLFGSTIGQAALPTLSQLSAQKNPELFRQTLSNAFHQVAFLAMPVSVLLIVLRIPIIRIVFGASTFPWPATLLAGKTLGVLAISASFYATMQLIIRGFYALHDTKTPLFVGLAAAIFDAVLSVIGVWVLNLGIVGIALALTATAILETSVLSVLLYKRISSTGYFGEIVIPLVKMVSISLVTGFGLWLPMRLLDQFIFDTTRTLPLIALTLITSIFGMTVYMGLSYLFKVEQLGAFINLIKRVRQWRQIISPPTTEPLIIPAPDQN